MADKRVQIWIGFAWGVLYVLIECVTQIFLTSALLLTKTHRSIGPIFANLHHFNNGEVGVVFVTFLYAPSPLTSTHGLTRPLQHRQHARHRRERLPGASLPVGHPPS